MIFENTIEALATFAKGNSIFAGLGVANLEQTYQWPLPANADRFVDGKSNGSKLARTIELKNALHTIWHKEPSRRKEIARWIVADWGGVRANSSKTLEEHFQRAEGQNSSTPFAGVSSYSKIFSVVDPKQYAILDARVVVSLNAIQVLAETKGGMAFPYISGRNNITGNQGKKRGFATLDRFSVKKLVEERGWQRVPRDEAYAVYSKLMLNCYEQCSSISGVMMLEMALFSQAEQLALLAAPDIAA